MTDRRSFLATIPAAMMWIFGKRVKAVPTVLPVQEQGSRYPVVCFGDFYNISNLDEICGDWMDKLAYNDGSPIPVFEYEGTKMPLYETRQGWAHIPKDKSIVLAGFVPGVVQRAYSPAAKRWDWIHGDVLIAESRIKLDAQLLGLKTTKAARAAYLKRLRQEILGSYPGISIQVQNFQFVDISRATIVTR